MSNFKEILAHGKNYLIANLATKALSFISIPVYTRLLTTEDFGIVNVFLGVAGILSSLLTLCTDQSVSRYYFDKKDDEDFKRFVGTSSILASVVFCLNALILIVSLDWVANLIGLSRSLTLLLIPVSFFNILGLTFEQIYTVLKQSRKIAMSSLIRAYVSFGLAVILILLMNDHKYMGQIGGLLVAGLLMSFIWINGIRQYFKAAFDKKYVNYIFKFSVPLIPYALSGIIIEQFSKISLAKEVNLSQAGFYSLALTISGIVSIITAVTHQAWAPYYFQYMNAKDFERHDSDIVRIFNISLLSGIFVSFFGLEIGITLANKDFISSLYLIPYFVYGYIFHQLAYVYMRNFSFVYKTYYSSIVVIASGLLNVLLNLFLIPKFGQLGAAYAFSFSYLLMCIISLLINRYFISCHYTAIRKFLLPLLIFICFNVISHLFYTKEVSLLHILVKFGLLIISAFILFYSDRGYVLNLIKKNRK